MGKMNATSDVLLGLFAEMVWDEALRKYKERFLYKEIDVALANGDEEAFIALSSELNDLRATMQKS